MEDKEKIERILEEPQAEKEPSERSFAMDLLTEFKQSNKRMFIMIIILIAVLVGTNMCWLYVFQSYDYTSTTTYEANGIHAIIDSDGNIISQDVTPEQWESFTKWWEMNGNSQKDSAENTN